jgi:GST-like protein
MGLPRFYFARSGNSLRAAIAIELAGVAVDKIALDMGAGEHKAAAFLALNPAGTVPVWAEQAEGDERPLVLSQSAAICERVLQATRPDLFISGAAGRARMQASVYAAVSDLAVQSALMRYLRFSPDSVRFIRRRWLAMMQAQLDGLRDQPFVCGPRMSLADIAHYPVVHLRRPLLAALGGFGHVLRWADRLRAQPAVQRAIDDAGLELPLDAIDLEANDRDDKA